MTLGFLLSILACTLVSDDDFEVRIDQDNDGHNAVEYGGDDCNDGNVNIHPSADEIWYDGVDQNCDEESDYDADADGYDSDEESDDGDDCDDKDESINPEAQETWYDGIDQDCNGDENEFDADADGYDSDEYSGDDCDDTDEEINPDATEIIDIVDNDCDGTTDHIPLSQGDVVLSGLNDDDDFGVVVAGGGDITGNGTNDLLVSAKMASANGDYSGSVYLFEGPLSAGDSVADAHAKLVGEQSLDEDAGATDLGFQLGTGLASGDLDGDTYDDIVISTPHYKPSGYSERYGAAYVMYGPVTYSGTDEIEVPGDCATECVRVEGPNAGSAFGSWVSTGDVNGDEVDDLLVASTKYDPLGAAFVFLGPIRDVDTSASGWHDPPDYAIYGGSSDLFSSHVTTFSHYLDGLGDINGDGIGDLGVGSEVNINEDDNLKGVAFLFSGDALQSTMSFDDYNLAVYGSKAGDQVGHRIAKAEDLDGDGRNDVLISAIGYPETAYAGQVGILLSGELDSRSAGTGSESHAIEFDSLPIHITGIDDDFRTGSSVDGIGDFDGDGNKDILIGAVGATTAGEYGGEAYLVRGPFDAETIFTIDLTDPSSVVTLLSEGAGDEAGESVSGVGDMNGDGLSDIVVGAHQDTSNSTGQVYLFYGQELP